MTLAISSHGTLVLRALQSAPTVFTAIAELGDITPPELSRNEFDASTQEKNIDAYTLGILRRGVLTIPLNFLPTDATHDHIAGVQKALITEPVPVDGWKILFPDGTAWVMSGQVRGFQPTAPVDGKLSAQVTIRMSGRMTIGGVVVG